MSSEGGRGGRRVKDLALRALGAPWVWGIAALGWVRGAGQPPSAATRPRPCASPGGLRVLVVAPHPDDEVAGCAGTILLHRGAGDAVTVLKATDGRRSRAL